MRDTAMSLMGLAARGWSGDLRAQSSTDHLAAGTASVHYPYRVEEVGTSTVLRYQHGHVFMVETASLIVLAVGILLFRRRVALRLAVFTTFVGAMFAFVAAPGMWAERVVISPTDIREPLGFWFAPMGARALRYSEVPFISIQTTAGRHGDRRVWLVTRTNGTQERIDPGELWEDNEDLVVDRLQRFGVRFK